MKPGSTEVLRLISEIFLLLQCAAAGSARALDQADHALAQVRLRQMSVSESVYHPVKSHDRWELHSKCQGTGWVYVALPVV